MEGVEVTVLLSTFNGAEHLAAQLSSLADQRGVVWKLHARDDGSIDNSLDQVTAWIRRRPEAGHRQLPHGSRGVVASYVELLASVDTPFFAFCDQDDLWYPHKLRWTLDSLRRQANPDDVAAAATDAHLMDSSLRRIHDSALRSRGLRFGMQPSFGQLLMLNAVTGATMVGTAALARELARVADREPPEMHDWLGALVASSAAGMFVNWFPTMAHRRHPDASTGQPRQGVGRVAAVASPARRDELVGRARRNACGLVGADVVSRPADRRALEQLMGTDHPVGRRDVVRLAVNGSRVWPTQRALSLLR